jgi:surface antigen/CII-binding regulator of phage lambda lysogenization HflD
MMNLRTTTPVSKSLALKWGIALVAIIIVATASFMWVNRPVSADQYDDKIRALQADMSRYQAESDRLNAEATSLANALAQITNEKNALQSQVNLSQNQYDQLIIKIADTEKQIADNQNALGSTLASLYVDDDISPIEMLASSKDISEFLNKQEYRNSIKKELSSTINRVKDLKIQLTGQKTEVEKVLNEQKAARDSLAAKESEQASLVAQTRNDEAAYQGLIRNSAAGIAEAKAQQAALRARSNSTGGYVLVDSGSLSAYPWNSSNCAMQGYMSTGGSNGNGGDGHGYGCRQCVSYVAWKIAKETGIYYQNWGNGGQWAQSAIRAGYQNLGNKPQTGSIAVMWGNPGHVAWVEGVSPDGTKVTVSQYNYNYGAGYGMYSEMVLSTNFFDQYVKIK